MTKLAGLRNRLGGPGPCLIDVTEIRQSRAQRREHRDVPRPGGQKRAIFNWPGTPTRPRVQRRLRRIIREVGQITKAKTSFEESTSESNFAEKKTGVRVAKLTRRQRRGVVPRLPDHFHLFRKRQGELVLPPYQVELELAAEKWNEAIRSIQLLNQLSCAGVGFAHGRRAITLRGDECRPEGDL